MSQQMTSKVDIDLPAAPLITERRSGLRWAPVDFDCCDSS